MSVCEAPYPWQRFQWQRLHNAVKSDRLAHALLFTGAEGLGKTEFAQQFADSLLYQSQQHRYAEAHPDCLQITPQDSQQIKVEQIRHACDFISKTSHSSGYRIVIINPAESMRRGAFNALLKSLEEPGDKTIWLLIAKDKSQLPATIRSRCQWIDFNQPEATAEKLAYLQQHIGAEQAGHCLQLAAGAPLAAIKYANDEIEQQRQCVIDGLLLLLAHQSDPVQLAEQTLPIGINDCLDCLSYCLVDWIHLIYNTEQLLINEDYRSQFMHLIPAINVQTCFAVYDTLLQQRRALNTKIAINQQLCLEFIYGQFVKIVN